MLISWRRPAHLQYGRIILWVSDRCISFACTYIVRLCALFSPSSSSSSSFSVVCFCFYSFLFFVFIASLAKLIEFIRSYSSWRMNELKSEKEKMQTQNDICKIDARSVIHSRFALIQCTTNSNNNINNRAINRTMQRPNPFTPTMHANASLFSVICGSIPETNYKLTRNKQFIIQSLCIYIFINFIWIFFRFLLLLIMK